ncbi:MAG: hypothetical protein AAF368_19080 [Planctomycetota bacterium]
MADGENLTVECDLVVVGDFLDVDPSDLLRLAGRGRDVVAVCLLTPGEMIPALGASEFIDPESGDRVSVHVDAALQSAYTRRLEQRLEAFASACAKRRVRFVCHDTRTPFEDLVLEVLEGRRGPRG